MARRLIPLMLAIGLASVAFVAAEGAAFAYPAPKGTATVVTGCATLAPGNSCQITYHFADAQGQPATGLPVSFTAKGVRGCTVTPTSGTTDGSGNVATTLSCSANSRTGTETVTAKSGKVSANAVTTVAKPAVPTAMKVPSGSASAASTSPDVFLITVLAAAAAALTLLTGAFLLRRRGSSAS